MFMLKHLFHPSSSESTFSHPFNPPFPLSHYHCFIAHIQRSQGTITADHIAQQHARPSQQAQSAGFTAVKGTVIKTIVNL